MALSRLVSPALGAAQAEAGRAAVAVHIEDGLGVGRECDRTGLDREFWLVFG